MSLTSALYYGNLGANCDFIPLLNAAYELRSEDVRVVIRGAGELLSQVLKGIAERGLQNVRVYHGTMSETELSELVQTSDVLVLPMGKHGYPDASFPIKFVEYLWAGKPIIYVGSGYPAQLIKKHGLGVVISDRDVTPIVTFVRELLADRSLVLKIGSRARRLAEQLYSEDRLVKSLNHFGRVGPHPWTELCAEEDSSKVPIDLFPSNLGLKLATTRNYQAPHKDYVGCAPWLPWYPGSVRRL
jgi:hypothetical protein